MNPSTDAGPILRDIHLPPAPGWWPPAPGWWLLAIAVLALLTWLLRVCFRSWRRRRHRRAVTAELDRSIDATRNDPVVLATALSQFLRRLSKHADNSTAALVGERWLEHLDQAAGSDEFTRGVGRVLIEAPFRPLMTYDVPALIALVRRSTRHALEQETAHA
ncbi:MAG TPA: DUF4381 family protein [Rudaea sp.]|jgi:hypothetical protein